MQDVVQEVDRILASVVNFEIRFSQKKRRLALRKFVPR